MKVKTDDNQIILTDLPILRWCFGFVFSAAGLQLVIPALLSIPNANGIKELFGVLFMTVFGGVFVFAGLQTGLSAAYQKIIIDRRLKEITVKKIGLKNFETTVYSSDEIEKIYSESETDSEDSTSHTICMTLKNDHSIVLGTPFGDKAECETVIKTAQTFLEQTDFSGKRQPSVIEDFSYRKILSKKPRRKKKTAFN